MKTLQFLLTISFAFGILSACQKDEMGTSKIVDQSGIIPAKKLKSAPVPVSFGTLATITFIGVEYTTEDNSIFKYEVTSGSKQALVHWGLNIMHCLPEVGVSDVIVIESSEPDIKYGKDGSLNDFPGGYVDLPWLQFDNPYQKNETRTVTFTLQGHWYVGQIIAIARKGNIQVEGSIGGPACQSPWTCGDPFIDERDGQEYSTVKIGTQCWMSENLAYLPSVSPNSEPSYEVSLTGKYYYVYGYEGTNVSAAKTEANYTTYGVLYNWEAAMDGCPTGWHLPIYDEWIALTDYLGANAGGKMKEAGTTHWMEPNDEGTNESGFTALPGGIRNANGGLFGLGLLSCFPSATGCIYENEEGHHSFQLFYYWGLIKWDNASKALGLSVRCLKDYTTTSP